MTHFADRLCEAVRKKGNPLCVGLDPRWESLPDEIRANHGSDSLDSVGAAFEEFCLRVLKVVAPLVPVVKPQSAFFEACGPAGMVALPIDDTREAANRAHALSWNFSATRLQATQSATS